MQYIIFNRILGRAGRHHRRVSSRRAFVLQAAAFLFFGGGGGGTIIRAYGFNVYRGGAPDRSRTASTGPAPICATTASCSRRARKNPAWHGEVPVSRNKHDVYMHDTTERQLFTQSSRALSHGCSPRAEPAPLRRGSAARGRERLLREAKVANTIAGGGEITLEHQIPVHMDLLLRAMVDDTGRVSTFSDIYGQRQPARRRHSTGRALKLESAIETSSADIDGGDPYDSASDAPVRRSKKVKQTYSRDRTRSPTPSQDCSATKVASI